MAWYSDIFEAVKDVSTFVEDTYDTVYPAVEGVQDVADGVSTAQKVGNGIKDAKGLYDKLSPAIDTAIDLGSYFLQDDNIEQTQQVQNQAIDQARTLSDRIYDQNRADIEPFRQSAMGANNRLSQLMGIGGIDETQMRGNIRKKYADMFTPEPQAVSQPFSGGEQNAPIADAGQAPTGLNADGSYNPNWTPYNEEADLGYIQRLTGNPEATSFEGWDPETKTYLDPNSPNGRSLAGLAQKEAEYRQTLIGKEHYSGQSGYRAAEDNAVRSAWERMTPTNLTDNEKYAQKFGVEPSRGTRPNMPNILMQEANRKNPFSGDVYNRRTAIEAMLAGDKDEMNYQQTAAHFDPRPTFSDYLAKATAAAILTGPLALGAAGAGATAASTTAAGLTGVAPTAAAAGGIKGSLLWNAASQGIQANAARK